MSSPSGKRAVIPPPRLIFDRDGNTTETRSGTSYRRPSQPVAGCSRSSVPEPCPFPSSVYVNDSSEVLQETINKLEECIQKDIEERATLRQELSELEEINDEELEDDEKKEIRRLKADLLFSERKSEQSKKSVEECQALLQWRLNDQTHVVNTSQVTTNEDSGSAINDNHRQDEESERDRRSEAGSKSSFSTAEIIKSFSQLDHLEDEIFALEFALEGEPKEEERSKYERKLKLLKKRQECLVERQARGSISGSTISSRATQPSVREKSTPPPSIVSSYVESYEDVSDDDMSSVSTRGAKKPTAAEEIRDALRELVKTEPPELPFFNGDSRKWAHFIQVYEQTTEEYKVKPAKNITRLSKALKGEARRAVAGLIDDPRNLKELMELLKNLFGRHEVVVRKLIQDVREFKASNMSRPESMVQYATLIQQLVARLKCLKEGGYLESKLLVDEFVAKLPLKYAEEWIDWVNAVEGRKRNLFCFGEFMRKKMVTLAELYDPVIQEEISEKRGPRRTSVHVAASEENDKPRNKGKCAVCDSDGHFAFKCPKLNRNNAGPIVREKRLCFRCFGNHERKDCKSKKICGVNGCTKHHHPLLHENSNEGYKPKKSEKEKQSEEDSTSDDHQTATSSVHVCSSKPLSVLPVKLYGENGARFTHATMDSACDTTMIDQQLADDLGLKGEWFTHVVKGYGGITVKQRARKVSFQISGVYRGAKVYAIVEAVTSQDLGLQPFSLDADKAKKQWPHLRRAKLKNMEQVTPKLIIGEDYPILTAHREILEGGVNEPMAKRTKLGWVFAGRKLQGVGTSSVHYVSDLGTDKLEQLMKSHWTMESFGVVPRESKGSVQDRRAMEILQSTVRKVGNRWETGLLWKEDNVELPESRQNALNRLISNERRLQRDPEYAKLYMGKLDELKTKQYVREVCEEELRSSNSKIWFLPHFGVQNVNKPGKIRFILDAAAKSKGTSLNDKLLPGPDLIRPIQSVLMNFRIHNVVITGDVEDMFPRVLVREKDQLCQLFLWREVDKDGKLGPIKIYAIIVLIFGATCSPACAIYVKNKNAEEFVQVKPEAVRAIIEDSYVDDCATGGISVEAAIDLRKDITDINAEGGFKITKWNSSHKEVIESIPEELRAQGAKNFQEKGEVSVERVLGLWWKPDEDIFTFSTNFQKIKPEILAGLRPNKREMVSLVMSIYDPLGFIANFKVKGLMLLQRTWKAGMDWDDPTPDSIYENWKKWLQMLQDIPKVKVKRCYLENLHLAEEIELHTIVDASEEAYAAACYLRLKMNGKWTVSFVCGKARVAPIKKLTIPRLELMAALMGTRLAGTVCMELRAKIGRKMFWSDSRTVLLWIRSEDLRLKEFVANRVGEIQDSTLVNNWKWIPTALNVADQATRYTSEIDLSEDSTWLTGPLFLQEENEAWPKEKNTNNVDHEEEEKVLNVFSTQVAEDKKPFIAWDRFSKYNRLLRAQSCVIAAAEFWLKKSKKMSCSPPWKSDRVPVRGRKEKSDAFQQRAKLFVKNNMNYLSTNLNPSDLAKGEEYLLRAVQREVFEPDIRALEGGKLKKSNPTSILLKLSPVMINGMLCVGGRIKNAQISERAKHPPILPARHPFTELVILNEHKNNAHQGQETVFNNLRQKYWILDGRAAVRRGTTSCWECKIRKVSPIIPKMGNLPYFRLVGGQPPFSFTAVDYFGPMEVVVGRHHEKRWGCLFTCMVTRAIHIEIAYALTTDEMLLAYTRFVATRGRPSHIRSDNGTNFTGANNDMKQAWEEINWDQIRNAGDFQLIEWQFQPPGSPHFGGVVERMVQMVKKVIKATLTCKFPRDQTLLTVMKGAENVINSRPLTYVSSDPADEESLTPNHFLRGFGNFGPEVMGEYEERDEILRVEWRKAQRILDGLWERWTKEFLPSLQKRAKWLVESEPLSVGDLVFMVDENQPRNTWTRGIVGKVFPGKDGQVRSVEVNVVDRDNGKWTTFRRGVDKICPLGLKKKIE